MRTPGSPALEPSARRTTDRPSRAGVAFTGRIRPLRATRADEARLADDSVALIRDVILCQLRAAGYPWRVIGEVLKSPHMSLYDRYGAIDPGVRAIYEDTPLGPVRTR